MPADVICAFGSSPAIRPLAPRVAAVDNASDTSRDECHAGVPQLPNKWLKSGSEDRLYHFGISKSDLKTIEKFADVKYVCTGGSAMRIHRFAEIFACDTGVSFSGNLSATDRYVIYLTGQVLWVNHGIGVPSLSIMLVECIKLLHYAHATDVRFIRIGTSGGVGVTPGTVVISSGALNGLLQPKHVQHINGKVVEHDAALDEELSRRLFAAARRIELPVERGLTFCTDDFYEGQMRLDGLFCDYYREDKDDFMRQLHALGVRNIEMESTGFAALTHRAKIPAVMCVAVVNRMEGDQVLLDKAVYQDFEMRPYHIISSMINGK